MIIIFSFSRGVPRGLYEMVTSSPVVIFSGDQVNCPTRLEAEFRLRQAFEIFSSF